MPRPPAGPRDLMSPAALHILLSLAEGERHGLAIKHEIEERTEGALVLGPGTLYEAIHRMVRDGWLEDAPETTRADGDGRRKYYRMTRAGQRAMEAELERLDRLVRHARSRSLFAPQGKA